MTTELRHRLTELAEDAPPAAPAPAPGDLWDRGRRYRRRRQAGTTGIALACVLLVSLVFGATWQRDEVEAQPTGEPGQVFLPDHFYLPSPWTPGTDEVGPLGRLVAVVGAPRKSWWSEEMGLVGVSATTGEYRFLDLPHYARLDGDGVIRLSLSPDGRYVGYWIEGEVAGERLASAGPAIVGYAVYDAVSGETREHRVDTSLGLKPQGIAWTTDEAWFFFGQHTSVGEDGGGSATAAPLEVMNTLTGESESLQPPRRYSFDLGVSSAAGGFVRAAQSDDGLRLVTDSQHPDGAPLSLGLLPQEAPLLSPDRGRVAFLRSWANSCCSPTPPFVVDLKAGGAPAHRVGSEPVDALLGWRDENHVVVLTYGDLAEVSSVDVETGEREPLTELASAWFGDDLQIASDLWAAPIAPGHRPPYVLDPRVKVGLVVGLLLAAGYGIVVWRRRVRA